ncbi:MAG: FkbM family methyltransferase [Variibacter sp.]|nr:FkbM family methyltransferase [Variibacter sp.]
MTAIVSYAQRFEDLYLLRCFGAQERGFYIDIGAGHPVIDSVSFAFYLRGWHGITAEPNRHLARLAGAVRPRDHAHEVLVGAAAGEAAYYLVDEFHGLSTTIAAHAQAAQTQFGKASQALTAPMVTLRDLCEQHAPGRIDFLKIDVEGAERDVLLGGDWKRFRPRVVLLEALAPFTLAPAWPEWEPLLTQAGYRYAFFDSLNRYYVAEEAAELLEVFATAPADFPDATLFRNVKPALADPAHPDRALAELVARAAMTRLPLMDMDFLRDWLLGSMSPAELFRPATPADVAAAWRRLFGREPTAREAAGLSLPPQATLRDAYEALLAGEAFRVACGRISGSYAW